jgi:hypothetical protein
MEVATLLLICAAVAAGVTGSLITAWSLRARIYALENQVAVVERTVTSYVKREAALARPRREDDVLAQIKASAGEVVKPKPSKQPWFARYARAGR